MAGLTGWHLILILAIVLLLFGAPKLPALARSLGQSMKIFKSEIKSPEDEKPAPDFYTGNTPSATSAPVRDSGASTIRSDSANSADTNPKP
jgi:sec-independent protein translocase protein TatA